MVFEEERLVVLGGRQGARPVSQCHQTGGQRHLCQGTRAKTHDTKCLKRKGWWCWGGGGGARPISQCHQTGGHIHPCQGTRRETHDIKCLRGKVGRDRGWRTRLQHPSFIKLVDRDKTPLSRNKSENS